MNHFHLIANILKFTPLGGAMSGWIFFFFSFYSGFEHGVSEFKASHFVF